MTHDIPKSARVFALTTLTMIAFAGNSLLCRAALGHTAMDAASFTVIRLMSGALMLWFVVRVKQGHAWGGSWNSALILLVYAVCFSFAYVSLSTATGALLLFGAVQATMLGHALWAGERLLKGQLVGIVLALFGLVYLLLPGLAAPPLSGAILMLGAGLAWGRYSLLGKGADDPTIVNAGNFLRASIVAVGAGIVILITDSATIDPAGFWYAVASGALGSGLGYVIWYTAIPLLRTTSAAVVQLSVPVIAAVGGLLFLGEILTLRLILASAAILGGIALVTLGKAPDQYASPR